MTTMVDEKIITEPVEAAPEEEEDSTELVFNLKGVKAKPKRKYKKGSKYDPIIDAFLKMKEKLIEVTVPEKDANYVRTQLKKRVEARELGNKIEVSVANNICFLERK